MPDSPALSGHLIPPPFAHAPILDPQKYGKNGISCLEKREVSDSVSLRKQVDLIWCPKISPTPPRRDQKRLEKEYGIFLVLRKSKLLLLDRLNSYLYTQQLGLKLVLDKRESRDM